MQSQSRVPLEGPMDLEARLHVEGLPPLLKVTIQQDITALARRVHEAALRSCDLS